MDQDFEYRRITSMPSEEDKLRCQIFAYVGADVLAERETVDILCNCKAKTPYRTGSGTNVVECGSCGTIIGVLGVEGGPGGIQYTSSDGTVRAIAVQGYD